MKLYFDPVSTTSRIVTFFLHDNDLPFDETIVSVLAGEQFLPDYTKINPNAQVPVLVEDDGFALTESSAIIRHLADKYRLPSYPAEPRARARVDEGVSWFQTNFHVYHCVLLSYTYVIPFLKSLDPQVLTAVRGVGQHGREKYLRILNDQMLAASAYVCGDEMTLADYVGAANVTLGYHYGLDLRLYPNISRWIGRMQCRKGWDKAFSVFEALIAEEMRDAERLRA